MNVRLLTLALWLAPAIAFAQERPVEVYSFSDTSCGRWAASQKDPAAREIYLYWFRGFVSGFNYGTEKYRIPTGAMPSPETLTLYIDKYCRDKPLNEFTGAAFELVNDVRVRRRPASTSP